MGEQQRARRDRVLGAVGQLGSLQLTNGPGWCWQAVRVPLGIGWAMVAPSPENFFGSLLSTVRYALDYMPPDL